MPAEFHGYGYNAWAGGPGSGFRRLHGGAGQFHHGGSGSVGLIGANPQGSIGHARPSRISQAENVGPGDSSFLHSPIQWGKGIAAIGKVLESGVQPQQRSRKNAFQPKPLGDADTEDTALATTTTAAASPLQGPPAVAPKRRGRRETFGQLQFGL